MNSVWSESTSVCFPIKSGHVTFVKTVVLNLRNGPFLECIHSLRVELCIYTVMIQHKKAEHCADMTEKLMTVT